ncbi:MAG: 3,4-dihydroxyphenylacetate 2,3-dioxygenase, partial [Microterricola sp.]
AARVLDLEGQPPPLVARTADSEMVVTVGADGFSYTRKEDGDFKLGHTL